MRDVRARWQAKCAHVLVDEYQDTNPAQYRLLRALVGAMTPFTAVGDDDQAIYGWRGATSTTSQACRATIRSLKVVKLEQNYRSTVRILRSANCADREQPEALRKATVERAAAMGDAIRVVPAADDEAEAEMVVRRISALKFERRAKFSDFAILYRGNHQARAFETALRGQNMPYDVSGGQSLFDKAEVKDIVAYLRLIANDDDDPAFVRAVTTPKRGVGQATLRGWATSRPRRHESLFAAVYAPELAAAIPARQHETLTQFCTLINNLRFRAEREPAGRLLNELYAATGYEEWVRATQDKREAMTRTQSVRDLIDWLSRKGEKRRSQPARTHADGRADHDARRPRRRRRRCRAPVDAARGEGPRIPACIPGGPGGRACCRTANRWSAGTVDEERRLMYVGMTRAQQSLHLSYCRRRKRAGECNRPARRRASSANWRRRTCATADTPLPPDEAAKEKSAGSERLKSLKAMLAR